MFLGSFCCDGDTTPKLAEPNVVFGAPNHGVLNALKDSARSWTLTFSVMDQPPPNNNTLF